MLIMNLRIYTMPIREYKLFLVENFREYIVGVVPALLEYRRLYKSALRGHRDSADYE